MLRVTRPFTILLSIVGVLFVLIMPTFAQEEEVAPKLKTTSSAATVAVGDTFMVSMAVSNVISPSFYLGVGELILASVENGVSYMGDPIGAVDIDSVTVDPSGESVKFAVRVVNNNYPVRLSSFVHGNTLQDGQIVFREIPGDVITVDVVAQLIAEAATQEEPATPVIALPEFDSTIDEQIDYSAWYKIAADTIGVTVADLMESTDTISAIARANDLTALDVILAIYLPERAELKALKREGLITADAYRTRRIEVRKAIGVFVKRTPIDPTTDVDAQEAVWSALELDTYTYKLSTSCYCFGLVDYRISVVDDVVVDVVVDDVDAVVVVVDDVVVYPTIPTEDPLYDLNPDPSDFRTLDDWFVYVSELQETEPYYLSARYDAVYGHPTSIYVDYPMITDEEIGYTITLIQE